MVGPWHLAPHRDHLQYIHHVHLMQWGQNRGVTLSISTNSRLDNNSLGPISLGESNNPRALKLRGI